MLVLQQIPPPRELAAPQNLKRLAGSDERRWQARGRLKAADDHIGGSSSTLRHTRPVFSAAMRGPSRPR